MLELTTSYSDVGRTSEAVSLSEQILPLCRRVLGHEHRSTVLIIENLGRHYCLGGRMDEGLAMMEEALELRRRVLGPEDPATLRVLHLRALALFDAGRRDESITKQMEVLELRRKVLGPEHSDTLDSKLKLIVTCQQAGNMAGLIEVTGTVPLGADSPASLATLVKPNSEWRWLHPVDGVDPAAADPDFHGTFFAPEFDDSGWSTGTDSERTSAGFGYGDEGFTGVDIGSPGDKSNRKTAYFRHRFTTGQEFTHLELRCRRDDGIIVYLDGREVIRNNVSDGPDVYNLPATWAVSYIEETTVFRFPLKDFVLPAGEHVLAISLHNTEAPSSDLSIGAISLVKVE
jgi:hypothetical protein